ncbi:unnamed protein product (macronuclear) [Paramecium tetraurelia]|uniref:MORN repeat protein n=1 Tax=Paramecium tetraurelia TaxID=5888 RepID=A0DVY3_PARTE|nr:uncharacterized protein GSPATT00020853001 [Paramecium tetraurelia]CAK87200.1 unnamed protein product [Paramecium tetraurelia]|eukprot:XP_001454597.1 hypothetical protein (macronuclear) [Paramecium tetraurelia strain d4-2]
MGICKSQAIPQAKDELEIRHVEKKPSQDQIKLKQEKEENEAALKIQSTIRGKKAKQELEKQKEELIQDKPQDWTEYHQEFIEPQLPAYFKEKVNYKPTNQNRFFPPYLEPDGTIYNGQWNKGEQNGFGQMLKPDGTYLKGLWKKGIFSEGGVLYPNGEFFIGNTKQGERCFTNGIIYKGEADYGIPHGKGEEIYPDGSKSEVQYKCGRKVQDSKQKNQ